MSVREIPVFKSFAISGCGISWLTFSVKAFQTRTRPTRHLTSVFLNCGQRVKICIKREKVLLRNHIEFSLKTRTNLNLQDEQNSGKSWLGSNSLINFTFNWRSLWLWWPSSLWLWLKSTIRVKLSTPELAK